MTDLLEDQHDPVLIHWAGATYEIAYDGARTANFVHPPRWYAVNTTNRTTTERYYSSPVGAFTAIYTGSAKWIK